jgi:hypothetical protein
MQTWSEKRTNLSNCPFHRGLGTALTFGNGMWRMRFLGSPLLLRSWLPQMTWDRRITAARIIKGNLQEFRRCWAITIKGHWWGRMRTGQAFLGKWNASGLVPLLLAFLLFQSIFRKRGWRVRKRSFSRMHGRSASINFTGLGHQINLYSVIRSNLKRKHNSIYMLLCELSVLKY